MNTVKLYLVETPGDGRAFSLSPVNAVPYLGPSRLYELPAGFEVLADPGADPVILDEHCLVCNLTTVPLHVGGFMPVLEVRGAFTRLKPVEQPLAAAVGR